MAIIDRAEHCGVGDRRRDAETPDQPRFERPSFLAFWRCAEPEADQTDQPAEPAPELDCLRGVLAPAVLDAAERRAHHLGIGADRVLIRSGVIDEQAYLSHLASHLSIACEDFAGIGRDDTPLADDQIGFAAASGLMPIRQNGELVWAVAPRRLAARTLSHFAVDYPLLRARLRLVTERSMRQFLQRAGDALARYASCALQHQHPTLSAAPSASASGLWRRAAAAALLVGLLTFLVEGPLAIVPALFFVSFVGLRLWAGCLSLRPAAAPRRWPDRALPIYTAIAALYREASSVGSLVAALEALDYPREKLDIILVVEPDDLATRAAIARLKRSPHLRVLIAPHTLPKTKPKALNYALPFVRGSMVAVFDAEDRPAPGQLRAALDAFAQGGPNIGCVQASLCIDNLSQSWLSRLFAAEYAGHFDAVLPGLTRMRLPLPLGGSSNHFRTDVLREAMGWDAYNVTEDADLGFRLARFGYRAISFASTTFEEAPLGFRAWRNQRTRWMKGWMQTWCVHMRTPCRFWREAGFRGVVMLNLFVGGAVMSALLHPLMILDLGVTAVRWHAARVPDISPAAAVHMLAIVAGYVGSATVALIGLSRRGGQRLGWWLWLMPLYWLCLSVAAWRALLQLVVKPHHWEKTEHGIAVRQTAPVAAVQK